MTTEEILAGESKNVEFKVQRPKDSGKYMKTVVAFSNGEGGRIIFGIDDSTRTVVGIPKEIVFSEIDAITSAISDSCEPLVIPDVYLQTLEDKTIIIAEISPGKQRPYYIKSLGIQDGTYIRVSGTSRPAGRDLTAEMYYEDEGRSYDNVIRKDLTVTEEEIQDLCQRMKQVALLNSKSQAQKDAVKDVTKNVLLSWGLLAEGAEGRIHPTNGYIFLLGKDPFLSQIQCGMFKGTTRAIFVDKREYGGALWEQIEAWGSGIPKLIQSMHSYGLKEPEFLDLEIGFRVNLYRSNKTPDTTQGTTQATQGTTQATISTNFLLTDIDKSILRTILQNPNLTQKEMALELGWTVDRVKYYLNKLKKRDILCHVGSSQRGHWEILLNRSVWDH
jgi:predicted HTH transcriptional regulator